VAAHALFAAPGALRALRGGRRGGAVELVLSGGAYLRLEEDWLLVTEPAALSGPLSISVAGLERGALHPGQRVSVRGERLRIGNQGVSLERVREWRPAARPAPAGPAGEPAEPGGAPARRGPDGGADGRSLAGGPFAGPIGVPPIGLAAGLLALARGPLEEGVRLLAGRGEGLTPAGDDALAGYAAWRHAAGRPVAISGLAAGRSSPLGLAYLRCAERGELPDAGVALLAALRSGDRAAASDAALILRTWGAGSGTAMLWGIAAGADLEGFVLDWWSRRPPGQDVSRWRRGRGPF
jgi:hypothetical protein